jgi:hypothetical protein
VRELAALLTERPCGVGPTIADRHAWQSAARSPRLAGAVANAERLLRQPIPALTDDLYLDYSRTGNRRRAEAVLGQRHGRLVTLVLAECLDNRGRFLPALDEAIRQQCREKTWVMPAHDGGLANFRGTLVEIDLQAAAVAWNLATAAFWLGDRLSPATVKLVQDELERRIFTPFTGMITRGKPRMWWLTSTNNWNAVCLAGVTGAALAQVESPDRRAFFIAAAEKYIRNYLAGITPDGYCVEGLGYWNYGFGHYTLLAETIRQATGGKVDLMADPKVRQLARFGLRMEILPGIYPALADCSPDTRPDPRLTAFLERRYGPDGAGSRPPPSKGPGDGTRAASPRHGAKPSAGSVRNLFELGVYGLDDLRGLSQFSSACPSGQAENGTVPLAGAPALRDWFPDNGVLVCRPSPERPAGMGVAIKGGDNGQNHGHNDLGSFIVALDGDTPLADPGAEVYTARTFSAHRFDSNVLNSFGHSVPRVAGVLQSPGRQACAKILATDFSDRADRITMDLRSAYPVKELKRLERTMVFARAGLGSLRVTDQIELASPKPLGTALITFSPWKQVTPGRLEIGRGPATIEVRIDAGGRAFRIEPTEIHEDLHGGRIPTRLGIELAEPVEKATLTLTISPTRPDER